MGIAILASIATAAAQMAAMEPTILLVAAWVAGTAAVLALLFAFVVLPIVRKRARDAERARVEAERPAAAVPPSQPLRLLASLRAYLGRVATQEKPDIIELLDHLLGQSRKIGASDIHLSPAAEGMKAAVRVDGLLYDLASFNNDARNATLVRVKVLSKLNVYKRDVPQDGRFLFPGPPSVDVRVSILPTIHGEKVVLRFLGSADVPYDIEHLGMDAEMLGRYRSFVSRPQGLILVTGPTGSGKTTTLYASLAAARERRGAGINLVTIENPVEYLVPWLNQTQVNEDAGLSFAAGLRSVLRQDPNVIMVGEIRDRETAEIAMQAGLTGQLIFSTVHAESSAGVVARLLNMGTEPFILASALVAVVGQRLVRRICQGCTTRAEPEAHQLELLKRLEVAPQFLAGPYWRGTGCDACLNMGVTGRTGLFELLEMTDDLREMIVKQVPTQQLHAAAIAAGMRPLLTAGLEQARSGVVTLDEVLSVVGS